MACTFEAFPRHQTSMFSGAFISGTKASNHFDALVAARSSRTSQPRIFRQASSGLVRHNGQGLHPH